MEDKPTSNTTSQPSTPLPLPPDVDKKSIAIKLAIGVMGLLVVVCLGWYIWSETRKTNESPISTPQPALTGEEEKEPPVEPADPTATWETYTSKQEGLHFKYPKQWKVKLVNIGSDPASDSVQLISSNKSTVDWSSHVDGIGSGECDPETDPRYIIHSLSKVPQAAGLYVAEMSVGNKPKQLHILSNKSEVKLKVGDTGLCAGHFHGLFKSRDGKRDLWLNAFDLKPIDFDTVKLLMLSVSY